MNRNRIIWYLKQALPMKYHTTYGLDGEKHLAVWKMWFGRCYQIEDYIIL